MEYKQKDLGYPRATTDARFRVEMPDGSLWEVPVQMIADSRDEHYREESEDTVAFIRVKSLDKYEITDWAGNNMDWDEVKAFAVKVEVKVEIDWQEGWINGEKEDHREDLRQVDSIG